MSQVSFQERSYRQHDQQYGAYRSGGELATHAKTWAKEHTVDAWRHRRMYQSLDPVLTTDTGAKWLTVGDGRYGCDAHYIYKHGGNVVASDISTALLAEAQQDGYIPAFRGENAEALSFADDSFDYVLCKESYHHFPRPMIALYEMLRVAKKGIFFIEPCDAYINSQRINDSICAAAYRQVRDGLKWLLRKGSPRHGYEESGNYIYSISQREMEKVALGLNYRCVAFKGLNDVYLPGVEFESLADNGPLFRKLKSRLFVKDLLCRLGLAEAGVLAAAIFKQQPTAACVERMHASGYSVVQLPENPYIHD